MKILKEKEVKLCICDKQLSNVVARTEWDQTLTILLTFATLGFLISLLLYLPDLGKEPFFDSNTILLGVILAIVSALMANYTVRKTKAGHSLVCSIRQAFFKVT